MRICTSVTDAEVQRAKNILKTNILLQFDGKWMVLMYVLKCFLQHKHETFEKTFFILFDTFGLLFTGFYPPLNTVNVRLSPTSENKPHFK